MLKRDLVIVEVIYIDAISGVLESVTGRINQYEIDHFNEHESNFIMPLGYMNFPICKDAITKIIIYTESDRIPCHKGKLIQNHQTVQRVKTSISS